MKLNFSLWSLSFFLKKGWLIWACGRLPCREKWYNDCIMINFISKGKMVPFSVVTCCFDCQGFVALTTKSAQIIFMKNICMPHTLFPIAALYAGGMRSAFGPSFQFDIDCGSSTFSAKALSKLNTGTAMTAKGETGSYSIFKSTEQPFSSSAIENIIRHLFATLRKPCSEKKAKSPLDTSVFSHTQHTLRGRMGGNPNISSTSSPIDNGLSTGLPRPDDGLTDCEDATIVGQFVGVAKKVCICSRDTPGTFVFVTSCSAVADAMRKRNMKW
uniref:Uncharacterized protein n=1 Tax=Helicotheca tamesis TaxID=374047 RepID=A0A7S2N5A2_9STRA